MNPAPPVMRICSDINGLSSVAGTNVNAGTSHVTRHLLACKLPLSAQEGPYRGFRYASGWALVQRAQLLPGRERWYAGRMRGRALPIAPLVVLVAATAVCARPPAADLPPLPPPLLVAAAEPPTPPAPPPRPVLPLFKRFPKLAKELPHVSLGAFPTPIDRAVKLGA